MENLKSTYTVVVENYIKRFMEKQGIEVSTIIGNYAQLGLPSAITLDMNDIRHDVDTGQKKGKIFDWIRFNLTSKGPITYTRYCLGKKARAPLTAREIKNRVERIVGARDLSRKTNKLEYVTWRQIAIHYTYSILRVSYQDITHMYGKKTHVAIMHAKKKADIYLETDKKFRDLYNEITSQI